MCLVAEMQSKVVSHKGLRSGRVLIGLGANVTGAWGLPTETLKRALRELEILSDRGFEASRLYRSKPVGPANQPDYVNAVCRIDTKLSPAALLTAFKALERASGRGKGRRWGPRPLDLDILDYKGRVYQWPGINFTGPRRRLILPHPELHVRAFVLKPLLDVAPDWRHPVLGQTARQMLGRYKRDSDAMRPIDVDHS